MKAQMPAKKKKSNVGRFQDYLRLAIPEPEILRNIGEQSVKNGTDKLRAREITKIIKKTRRGR
jgi:hypothetical protein